MKSALSARKGSKQDRKHGAGAARNSAPALSCASTLGLRFPHVASGVSRSPRPGRWERAGNTADAPTFLTAVPTLRQDSGVEPLAMVGDHDTVSAQAIHR